MAKCKLGKVKIEPMLVVGFCLTGVSGLPPKRMIPGGRKGLAPPLHWRGTLPVQEGIFADSSQSEWIHLPPSEQIKLPVLPSHWYFQTILISIQVSIFPLVQCDHANWWLPTGMVPCLGLKCSCPLPTFEAPVPQLIYW